MRAAWRVVGVVLVLATSVGCGAPDDNPVLQPRLGAWQRLFVALPSGSSRTEIEMLLQRNGAKEHRFDAGSRTLHAAEDTAPQQLGVFPFLVVRSVAITCRFDANERLLRCEAHASRERCCEAPK